MRKNKEINEAVQIPGKDIPKKNPFRLSDEQIAKMQRDYNRNKLKRKTDKEKEDDEEILREDKSNGTIWYCYEPDMEGEYTLEELKDIYEERVNKNELDGYSDFESWLYDMEKSGIFIKEDNTESLIENIQEVYYNIYVIEEYNGEYTSTKVATANSEEQAMDKVAELETETGYNAYYRKVVNGKELRENKELKKEWEDYPDNFDSSNNFNWLGDDPEDDEDEENEKKDYKPFSGIEFEKQIPHTMRFKEYDIVDYNSLYWITQQFFSKEELNEFVKAFNKTRFTKAYITVRDLSTYDFEQDLARDVLVTYNRVDGLDTSGYVKHIENKYSFDFETGEWKD